MPETARARVEALIDRVAAAAASPENARRRGAKLRISFGIEEPIAWTLTHDLDVARYYGDPLYYAEQYLSQRLWRWETFPDDGAPIEAALPASLGFYPEYTYAGLGVRYNERGVPEIQTDHPLAADPDLRRLSAVDFASSGWMPRALAWHAALAGIAAGRLAVPFAATWWRGCLDLAMQFRGYEGFLADTAERPVFAHALLSFLVEQRCRWWEGYERHFGTARSPTAIGDDWINVPFISPEIFREFVLPRYLQIERFHAGVAGIHSCGNQAPVQRYLLEIRSLRAFEVSAWTDLGQSLANIPADRELIISLHPNDVLCAAAEQMRSKLSSIIEACRGRAITIGTSGLTPLSTDIDDFVRRLRTWNAIAKAIVEEAA
jgi:hypothetical protein